MSSYQVSTALQKQNNLLVALQSTLNDIQSNKLHWKDVTLQCLSSIRNDIESLSAKEEQLLNSNLILQNKILFLDKKAKDYKQALKKIAQMKKQMQYKQKTKMPAIFSNRSMRPSSNYFQTQINPKMSKKYTVIHTKSKQKKLSREPSIFVDQIHKGWKFSSMNGCIANSDQLSDICQQLQMTTLPEMVFADSYLKIEHENGFCLEFNAIDALRPCSLSTKEQSNINNNGHKIEVAYAKDWKRKANVPCDIEVIEYDFDWTFTSDYKGTYASNVTEIETDERLNMQLLTDMKMSMNWNSENMLFMDELHDNGMVQYIVRCRVMDKFFFILARCWLRVDNVLIRIHDTRIFHEFGQSYILKHYQFRENSFQELKLKYSMNCKCSDFRDPNIFEKKIDIQKSKFYKIFLQQGGS